MPLTELHANPDVMPMGSRETLPVRFDVGPLLAAGEFPLTASATLTRLDTGATFPAGLVGSAAINGTYITQTVTGLTKDVTYRLSMQFQAASGKTFEVLLDIPCRD